MIVARSRVLRGGSWINNGRNARSAYRNRNEPDNRNDNIGFRLALARKIAETSLDQIAIRSAASRCGGKKPTPPGAPVGPVPTARRGGFLTGPA